MRPFAPWLALPLLVPVPVDGSVEGPVVDPLLALDAPARALVRYHDGVAPLPAGVSALYRFGALPAVYVDATAAGLQALASDPRVAFLEADHPIALHLATATVASRARDVFDHAFQPATPALTDAEERRIDGQGVAIAIVDTGVDGTHPDLADRLAGNHLVTPAGLVDAAYTSQGSPHGTHVAGIAVGTGAASGGVVSGAAPGAMLHAFAVMPGGTVAFPAIAFDWILQHGDEQSPPIRVVSNSWSCVTVLCHVAYRDRLHVQLASELARSGVVVTWSAGNEAGDGFLPLTAPEATNPTPGVISVAAYDDDDRGLVTRCVAEYSSRGAASDPATWPDVAAPGSRIFSAWPIEPSATTRSPLKNTYRELSGTSMAAPHVAGVVALMLQARPDLAPADVEHVLKATARKLACGVEYPRADAAHTYDGANYVDGHGLVDAYAAVLGATGWTPPPPPPPADPLPQSFLERRVGVEPRARLHLTGAALLAPDEPSAQTPRTTLVRAGDSIRFESLPLAATSFSGVEIEVWMGSTAELPALRVNGFLTATLERVIDSGLTQNVATDARPLVFVPFAAPTLRQFVFPLDEPVTLQEGERLRLTLAFTLTGANTMDAAYAVFYWGSPSTPSAVVLGERAPALPLEPLGCQVRADCARIGAGRDASGMQCDGGLFRVLWRGPPGSTAAVSCETSVAVCTVPDAEGATWGTCVADALLASQSSSSNGVCSARDRDGRPSVGEGRCEAIVYPS